MTDTDTFANVTSDDVRPGETPAAARTRRKVEKAAAKRSAAKAATPPPTRDRAPRPAPAEPASSTTPPPARPVGRPTKLAKNAEKYRKGIVGVGKIVGKRNAVDGAIIMEGADDLAIALADLAEQNPTVAKVLDIGSLGGAWSQLALAAGAIALPIAINHGLFDRPAVTPATPPPPAPPAPGVPNPATEPGGFVIPDAQPDPLDMSWSVAKPT